MGAKGGRPGTKQDCAFVKLHEKGICVGASATFAEAFLRNTTVSKTAEICPAPPHVTVLCSVPEKGMAARHQKAAWDADEDFSSGSSSSDEDNLPIGGRTKQRFSAATSAGFSLGGGNYSTPTCQPATLASYQGNSVFSMYAGSVDDHVASNGDWNAGAQFTAGHAAIHDWGSDDSDAGVDDFDRAVRAHTGLSAAEIASGAAARPRSRAASEASEASGAMDSSHGGIRTLLQSPVPQSAEATQFYITRTKHILGNPTWSLFLEQNDQFLCSAKVCPVPPPLRTPPRHAHCSCRNALGKAAATISSHWTQITLSASLA